MLDFSITSKLLVMQAQIWENDDSYIGNKLTVSQWRFLDDNHTKGRGFGSQA